MERQSGDGPSLRPVERFTETKRNLPHHQDPGSSYFITFSVRDGELSDEAMRIAFQACLFWDGSRCTVHACVVLPDHAHVPEDYPFLYEEGRGAAATGGTPVPPGEDRVPGV